MSHNWGQRYFETDPSDTDPNRRPPNRNTPKFHEVFGDHHVRNQDHGGWRGGRGRGRGRGRGQGRGRDRGWRGSRGRWNGDGRGRHHPADRQDYRSREDGPDFHVGDDVRARDIFEVGGKRPTLEPQQSLRKKKKRYIPGGAIPRFQRLREYKEDPEDTYCEICNEHFRDVNAKSLHDRSYKHRRNYGYWRKEEENKANQQVDTITNQASLSAEDRRKKLEIGVNAFLSISEKKLPPAFKEWVNKSLEAARAASNEGNDASILQAVQCEVVDVFRVHDADCTLRRVSWTRRELATGAAYRSSQQQQETLPVIPDEKIHTKSPIVSKKEEEAKAGKARSTSVASESVADTVVQIVDTPVEPQNPASQTESEVQPNGIQPATNPSASEPCHVPYRMVTMRWRNSRGAGLLQSSCEIEDKEAVFAKYHAVFGKPQDKSRDLNLPVKETDPTESTLATYRELCRQYESEDYVYDDLMQGLSSVAQEFEKDGKHKERLRSLYQLQIQLALLSGEYCDCFEPCSKYVRTFDYRGPVRVQEMGFIGHWFVALLFNNKSAGSRKRFSAMLELAQEMRRLPEGALENAWMYFAVQAAKGVLGNNWCGFFGRSMTSVIHYQGGSTKQVLEGLVPFMREKALVVMTYMNKFSMISSRQSETRDLRLSDVRRIIGWDASGDVENSIAEAKDFVSSLPQPLEIVRGDDCSDWIRWTGKGEDELRMSEGNDVKYEMLANWSRPISLENEDVGA